MWLVWVPSLLVQLGHAVVRGELWTSSVALALGPTILLVVVGVAVETRTFRRESA